MLIQETGNWDPKQPSQVLDGQWSCRRCLPYLAINAVCGAGGSIGAPRAWPSHGSLLPLLPPPPPPLPALPAPPPAGAPPPPAPLPAAHPLLRRPAPLGDQLPGVAAALDLTGLKLKT